MKSLWKRTLSAAVSCAVSLSIAAGMNTYAEVTPNPVISRNCPAYCTAGTAAGGNDEHYFSFWNSSSPDYLAYDLSAVPEEQRSRIMAVWYNTSSYDAVGQYQSKNMVPSDYTIEVNAASGGEYPSDGWKTVETVKDNTLASRQHLVDFKGYNWIRINISTADGEAGKNASINFDIHNVSDGVSDSWLFLGDSITAGGMNNCYGTGYATYVNRLDDRFFPIQENGGIGGIRSSDGKENIDRWLSTYPGKYVSIAYGTNDAWGNGGGSENYYNNTKYMVDAVLAAGKTPVLPKIPYSTNTDVGTYLPEYNEKIDMIYEEYGDKIVKGPDFYEFFKNDNSGLSGDGVHPSSEGYDAMRQLWAKTMYETVYTAESGGEILYGDANENGTLEIADVVLIMQAISDNDKYGVGGSDEYAMTANGKRNADCYKPGSDLTSMDALSVQRKLAGLISSLPEI